MSTGVIFSIGVLIFGITVYGMVMVGGLFLGRYSDDDVWTTSEPIKETAEPVLSGEVP